MNYAGIIAILITALAVPVATGVLEARQNSRSAEIWALVRESRENQERRERQRVARYWRQTPGTAYTGPGRTAKKRSADVAASARGRIDANQYPLHHYNALG